MTEVEDQHLEAILILLRVMFAFRRGEITQEQFFAECDVIEQSCLIEGYKGEGVKH